MAPNLTEDPHEQEMLLRALREYSERCEPPGLTPECPFSIETEEPGVRGCGEECMDLLAAHNAPSPVEEVDFGGGFMIRRARSPRARRAQRATAKAFDAREILLEDQATEAVSRWRLAAILRGLIEEVQKPPPDSPDLAQQRRDKIEELMTQVKHRGLDPENHVLPQLRPAVAGIVFARLLRSLEHESEMESFDHSGGWAQLARRHFDEMGADQSDETRSKALGALLGSVFYWSQVAQAEDILNWFPPDPLLFVDHTVVPVSKSDDDGTWIVERFTITYLKEWSLPALQREWRYLHGQHPSPCPPQEMAVRTVPEAELAVEIVKRQAANDFQPSELTDLHSKLSDQLVRPAVGFIGEGRRVEAAALFEAAVQQEPDNANALNNLGFCLLPDDPARALEILNQADRTGGGDTELISVNRALALAMIGRFTSATDLAAATLDQHADSPPRSAWLWDIHSLFDAGEPELFKCDDLPDYVEAILIKIRIRSLIDEKG